MSTTVTPIGQPLSVARFVRSYVAYAIRPKNAPVAQQRVREQWAVSFMMPATYTLETLPAPEDPQVTLRQVPARRIAAVRYSGSWSEKGYLRHKEKLESWMRAKGRASAGDPQWARYNSPFSLWFLRRNEILIPVAGNF